MPRHMILLFDQGSHQMTIRRLLTTLAPLAALALTATPVLGHTGTITVSQDCESFHVSVSLDHNTTSDRSVMIETTIPGTTGIAAPGNYYDTSFGEIWSASGPAPASGTVTLIIDNGTEEFRTSATLVPAEDCPVTVATPTPTPTPTPAVVVVSTPTPTPRQGVLGGNPTPAARQLPNTAVEGAEASTILMTLGMGLVFLVGLGFMSQRQLTSRRSPRP